jgi:hypothetical protein
LSYAAAPKATIDPSELAAGSRPLGLGRAYVGLADDAYSVFQNPAGLARIRDWQLASMYSRVIEEVDYHLLGTVHPMGYEAVGVGYLKAAVGGSLFSRRDPVTDRIVPDPDAEGAMGYNSEVLFFSYALFPEKYFTQPFLKNVSVGVNLKIFNQSLTGIPTGDVSALGHDLDLGLQYHPNSWLTLGAAGYNVLPYDLGKLMWGSGISESIPASFKVGFAAKLIGKGGLREYVFYPQDLVLAYDYEFVHRGDRPGLSHLGLEWRPFEILSLRLGLDQDAVATGGGATGIDDNFSAGVGLNLFNFRFDYAFHTFGALSANDTHFFSITYGVEAEKLPPYVPPRPRAYIEILEPGEKHVTFNPYVVLKGRVNDLKNISEVKVNQSVANLYEDATFISMVKLPKYGRNTVEVQAISTTGRILETKYLNFVRLMSFVDIGIDHPLRYPLGGMGALGYVYGFKDGTFKPEGYLTRAELCTLLIRIRTARKPEPPLRTGFTDISQRHWAAGYIAEGVRAGIIKGFPDGKFRPAKGVTREQAIAFLVRFAEFIEPDFIYEKPFPDVEVFHWSAKAIHLAKKEGFLDYLKGKNFEPERKITRGEVADIMSRIKSISIKLKELLE